MKKLLKRSLLSILALFMLFAFTPLASNKVYAKSDSIININDSDDFDLTPAYVTDHFFWTHTSQFTTWSYNEEGSYIKFKVPRPQGGERTFRVYARTYKAEKLKSYIREITDNEYTAVSGAVGVITFLVAGMATGGISIASTGVMLYGSGKARAALENLNRLYPEAARFAESNF